MTHPPAQPEERGGEETRSLIQGLNGTMHGSSNLRVRYYENARDFGLWRFRVWGLRLAARWSCRS